MSVWDRAGLFTDVANPGDPQRFKALGYTWIVQQAQNGPDGPGDSYTKDINLSAYKAAGFKVGPWGVTYNAAYFERDGRALAARANDMWRDSNGEPVKADLLVIDAEECLKNADPTPLIRGLADFPGAKALSTLGAASGLNTFPIRYDLFLAAGYDILPQAYYNWAPEYAPAHCLEHAARAGIPRDRVHLTVDTTGEVGTGDVHRVDAPEQLALLQAAGVGCDVSIFMAENDYGYELLGTLTNKPPAPPPPAPPKPAPLPSGATKTRAGMLVLGRAQEVVWEAGGWSRGKVLDSRIGLADAVLALSDAQFAAKRAALRTALGV